MTWVRRIRTIVFFLEFDCRLIDRNGHQQPRTEETAPGNDDVHGREPTEHCPVGPFDAGTVDLEAVRPRVDSVTRTGQDGPTNRTADEPNLRERR